MAVIGATHGVVIIGGSGLNGLVNSSTPGWVHACIPAISVDERKNAMSANQSLNSTNLQEALCHDVIVLGCDWCNLEQWLTDCNEA